MFNFVIQATNDKKTYPDFIEVLSGDSDPGRELRSSSTPCFLITCFSFLTFEAALQTHAATTGISFPSNQYTTVEHQVEFTFSPENIDPNYSTQ
jgi:hypothetical protein